MKRIWEYCKQCLSDKNCTERSTCEQNTTSETLKYTMGQTLARGKLDAVKYLVEVVGFDVDTPLNEYQSTALFRSAYYGGPQDLEILRYLVSRGANVNSISTTHNRTPLLTSIWKHNNAHARFLLSHGADPSIPSDRGMDACAFAYRWQNWSIMPDLPGCCARWASPSNSQSHPPELLKACQGNNK
jgi:ankyrin repeat protein